jgi:uncharacterized OB-fold protein
MEAGRPLPRLDEPDTAPFWRATCEGRLCYQVCRGCGGVVFYPRRHCTRCTSLDLEWRESTGLGTVYTYTVVRQHGHEFFRRRAPYVVAFVDLDEGFRMLAEVVGTEPGEVRIGQRVRLDWEDHQALRVPLFRPDGH